LDLPSRPVRLPGGCHDARCAIDLVAGDDAETAVHHHPRAFFGLTPTDELPIRDDVDDAEGSGQCIHHIRRRAFQTWPTR